MSLLDSNQHKHPTLQKHHRIFACYQLHQATLKSNSSAWIRTKNFSSKGRRDTISLPRNKLDNALSIWLPNQRYLCVGRDRISNSLTLGEIFGFIFQVLKFLNKPCIFQVQVCTLPINKNKNGVYKIRTCDLHCDRVVC